MKLTVTIPDELAKAVDDHAESAGLTCSEVYARAVEQFLGVIAAERALERFNQQYTHEAPLEFASKTPEDRTEQINQFLERTEMELDSALREAARQTFKRSEW